MSHRGLAPLGIEPGTNEATLFALGIVQITGWREHKPTRMIGRIGYPGDQTVRYAPGIVETELEITQANGARHTFTGEEAEAIALILGTEIP